MRNREIIKRELTARGYEMVGAMCVHMHDDHTWHVQYTREDWKKPKTLKADSINHAVLKIAELTNHNPKPKPAPSPVRTLNRKQRREMMEQMGYPRNSGRKTKVAAQFKRMASLSTNAVRHSINQAILANKKRREMAKQAAEFATLDIVDERDEAA